MTLRVGSLFSGAGGLETAVCDVFGAEVAWQSEIDPAASKVLAHRFPGVPNLGDITAVDWADVERVDVLCGGFPCQDVSMAGKRAGIREGTRSGLWAVFADAIDALRPRWVVIENVRGLLSADGEEYPPIVAAAQEEYWKWIRVADVIARKLNRAQRKGNYDNEYIRRKLYEAARVARLRERALARFQSLRTRFVQRAIGTVIAALSDLGYDAQWTTVSAADVGAPHRRERVFILAHAADADSSGRRAGISQLLPRQPDAARRPPADAPRARPGERLQPLITGIPAAIGGSRADAPTDTAGDRRHEGRPESARLVGRPDVALGGAGAVDLLPTPRSSRGASTTETAYALGGTRSDDHRTQGQVLLPTPTSRDHKGRNQRGDDTCLAGALLPTPRSSDCFGAGLHGDGGMDLRTTVAMATDWGKYAPAIARWESITRPAPPPTEPNSNGNPRLAAAFSEWMQGWPGGWVTDPAIGIGRNDQLRIIGNGVVSQQAAHALAWLLSVCEVAWCVAGCAR